MQKVTNITDMMTARCNLNFLLDLCNSGQAEMPPALFLKEVTHQVAFMQPPNMLAAFQAKQIDGFAFAWHAANTF